MYNLLGFFDAIKDRLFENAFLQDQLKPKLVEALVGYHVLNVACGSGDAQTLCITDDDNVWSWGDGDYGKLGRGGSDGCKEPKRIEALANQNIIKVS